MSYYLAGDIGGTKTLLQVFKAGQERTPVHCKSFPSASFAGLGEIVEIFLQEAGTHNVNSACFALAGPVSGRKAKLTNLSWEVDAENLETRFKIPRVALINDFEAVGHGIAALDGDDLLTLQQGKSQAQGTRIVVGAGTGLGVAWLSWTNNGYAVHASEGGHIDFAPSNELQYALLSYMQQRYGHVSYERIVSGPGLVAIYEFLRDEKYAVPTAEFINSINSGDAAAEITRYALEKKEPIAMQTLELFIRIYGAFVGNIALAALPRGGVYIAGGIAAKIAGEIQQGELLNNYLDKGRFRELLQTFPVSIVMNAQVGLLGASLQAQKFK